MSIALVLIIGQLCLTWSLVPYQVNRQMAEKINRLKSVLVDKDLSQKEFAKRLSVSQNTISRICTNETQPSLKLLRKMAIALEVQISDLLVPINYKK
jgi:putative transcriptional regulator